MNDCVHALHHSETHVVVFAMRTVGGGADGGFPTFEGPEALRVDAPGLCTNCGLHVAATCWFKLHEDFAGFPLEEVYCANCFLEAGLLESTVF